ncbi:MAG: hypothetical protein EA363_08210 [Balneolaceae bacterium]|nr:MAG: hypothetical protein EA363_08210 [Balneolaceae bacterium]
MPVFLVQCGKGDADREANRLFVEAYRLTESGQQSEARDPVEAYSYYRQAVEKIDNIIDNYPDTPLAVDVAQRRTRIGDITIGQLRDKVPRFSALARAMDDFHELTIYLIQLEDEQDRGLLHLSYARLLYEHGQEERHEEVVSKVLRQADRHWDRELIDRLYLELSMHFSNISRWERSLEVLDRIQDQQLLYEALYHLIADGYMRAADGGRLGRITTYLDYVDPVSRLALIDRICDDLLATGNRPQAVSLLQEDFHEPSENRALEYIDVLSRLSMTLANHGEYDYSRIIIKQIEKIDSNYYDFARRELATVIARHGEPGAAVDMAGDFDREYFRHTAFAAIAVELVRQDSLSMAFSLMDRIPDTVTEKTQSLLEIALLIEDNQEISDSLLQVALPRISDISSPLLRSNFQISVADVHIQRDRRSQAAEAMEQAEAYASEVSDAENINQLITTIIKRWVALGRPDRALDIAAWYRMDHPSFERQIPGLYDYAISRGFHDFARTLAGMTDQRAYYRYMLISAYLDRGLISQPMEHAYEIRNYYWRTRAQALLIADLKNKVNLATAERVSTDALLTMQRIRDRSDKQRAFFHAASMMSAAGISMDRERRPIVIELLGQFDI